MNDVTMRMTEDERYMNYNTGDLHTGTQLKEIMSEAVGWHGTEPIMHYCQGRAFVHVKYPSGAELTFVRTR
jgi:hypothetical protein